MFQIRTYAALGILHFLYFTNSTLFTIIWLSAALSRKIARLSAHVARWVDGHG